MDIFSPKAPQAQPTAGEKAASANAERDRLEAIRQQAEQRTAQLMRMFGSRGALGFGSGTSF